MYPDKGVGVRPWEKTGREVRVPLVFARGGYPFGLREALTPPHPGRAGSCFRREFNAKNRLHSKKKGG
jgi:hypothetical protein